MGDFPKLQLKAYAQIQDRETPEAKYWNSFVRRKEEKIHGTPNSIHFDPAGSGSYILTGSTRIALYAANTDRVQRAYTRFQDEAYSARFRKDGKLILAGDKTGNIKVFDVQTKAALRQIKAHSAAVRATVWASDGLHMISGSDDMAVKVWDLGTEELIWEEKNSHNDYVRSLDASPVDGNVFMSASYDHLIKIWDRRQSTQIASLNHDHPVSKCVTTSSGMMLVSAGGNNIKVWDLMTRRMVHSFSNHQKDVTDICLDAGSSRMLSCGLDGHLKFYDFHEMKVVHGMKYSSPLTTVGLSLDSKKIVVGCVDGKIEISNYKPTPEDDTDDDPLASKKASKATKPQSMSRQGRFYKGAGAAVDRAEDEMVETERVARLRPYELHLKKFNYQLALDTALKSRNPLIVTTVLEELCRRNALVIALSGRDEVTLEPLLAFASRFVANPKYSRLVLQVVHAILDIYSATLGHSDAIDELFLKLHKQVRAEVGFQKQIMRVMGSLDAIINTSLVTANATS